MSGAIDYDALHGEVTDALDAYKTSQKTDTDKEELKDKLKNVTNKLTSNDDANLRPRQITARNLALRANELINAGDVVGAAETLRGRLGETEAGTMGIRIGAVGAPHIGAFGGRKSRRGRKSVKRQRRRRQTRRR